ncbi:MAG: hypothetical protein R2710_20630 [Acidimicrobiales bacterium]
MLNNLRGIEFRTGDLRSLSSVVAAQIELPTSPSARGSSSPSSSPAAATTPRQSISSKR